VKKREDFDPQIPQISQMKRRIYRKDKR